MLTQCGAAGVHQPGRRIDDQIAGFAIDEEIFLLDTQGVAGLLHRDSLSENGAGGNGGIARDGNRL